MPQIRNLAVFLLLFLALASKSEVPSTMNFQCRITDSAGDPVPDGNYSMTFRIYDDSLSGDALWSEGRLVSVGDGLLSVELGKVVPLLDTIFSSGNRWLGIQIGLEAEINPRTRLSKVPYSSHSQISDIAISSLDKTIDATDLTMGTLDTQRYSAYEDIISENKIGDQANQLAPGNHSHSMLGIRVIQDTTSFDTTFIMADGEITVRTLTIPSNTLGSFFSVFCSLNNAPVNVKIRVNGLLVGNDPSHSGLFAAWITKNGDFWRARTSLNSDGNTGFSMDTSQDNEISISVEAVGGGSNFMNVGASWIELGPK